MDSRLILSSPYSPVPWISLPLPLQCYDNRCAPPCLVHAPPGTEPMLGKHSIQLHHQIYWGTVEMAQQVQALAAKPVVLSLIHRTYRVGGENGVLEVVL